MCASVPVRWLMADDHHPAIQGLEASTEVRGDVLGDELEVVLCSDDRGSSCLLWSSTPDATSSPSIASSESGITSMGGLLKPMNEAVEHPAVVCTRKK